MAGQKRDFYEVLGLSKGADEAQIKKAYRRLAKENHPDVNPGDSAAETRFKEVNEAYEVLSDADKKGKYDQFGHAGVDPSFGAGAGGFHGTGFGGMEFDLGDIFGSFFGGGGGSRNGPQRGERVHVTLGLRFEEAAFGCKRDVTAQIVQSCETCDGTGAAAGTTPETCGTCRGSGNVQVQRRTAFGMMNTTGPCQACQGTGKLIKKPCVTCKGRSKVRKNQKIEVNIPAGIDDGQTISLRGKGHAGTNGGPPGDFLVTVDVQAHETFERDGYSVLSRVQIGVVQAMLGDEIEVETLDGKVKYTVPQGTQSGTVFRLRGRGIPRLQSSGRGDHYVTVVVDIPTSLDARQRELAEKLGESLGQGVAEKQSFFEKRKKK